MEPNKVYDRATSIGQEAQDVDNTVASSTIGHYIANIATQAERDRRWVEDGWLDDMRQLKGQPVEGEPHREHKHNITRSKTLTAEARISDMLFQVGDKNFTVAIDELIEDEQIRERQEDSAKKLEQAVYDLLDECDYEGVGRRVIKQATELGVGVIKGPVSKIGMEKEWLQNTVNGELVNTLKWVKSKKTIVEYVPAWNYFPDMSAANRDHCSFEFQRHYMSKTNLQKLLLRGDFNNDEIIDMINTDTPSTYPRHLAELRESSLTETTPEDYLVWEGNLTIPLKMVKELITNEPERQGCYFDQEDVTEDFDIEVLAWVSESGRLLKFSPTPLETDERPFSVFCYDRDTACFMASSGVPRLVRNAQRDVNQAWDRMNDNADLSTVPQWIYNPLLVEPIPVKGVQDLNMKGGKGWRMKRDGDLNNAFKLFRIDSGLTENMALLDKAIGFGEVETQLPQIASGEQGANMTRTFQGMSLLLNQSNATQRRIVKDYDDNITIPLVDRLIDDTMQNRPIRGVFGKFTPKAQATSGMMLKETQAKNAQMVSQIAASNPQFAKLTDWKKLYEDVLSGVDFEAERVMKSDKEIQAEAQKRQPSAEETKAQADMIDAQAKKQQADNEKQKIGQSMQNEQQKHDATMRELDLKERKAQADAELAERKLDFDVKKFGYDQLGKDRMTDKKIAADKQGRFDQGRIEESKMASEFKLEKAGGRNPVVI